jgi:hypothetical protein
MAATLGAEEELEELTAFVAPTGPTAPIGPTAPTPLDILSEEHIYPIVGAAGTRRAPL